MRVVLDLLVVESLMSGCTGALNEIHRVPAARILESKDFGVQSFSYF